MKTKRTLFSALCAVAAFATTMAANNVTLNWHAELITPAGNGTTQINDVKINASGDVFEFANFGTIGKDPKTASFMNTEYAGSAYTGTSSGGNSNFLLTKHDLQGKLAWSVYSNAGEVDIAGSGFVPTADGGVVLALKLRPTVEGGDSAVLVTLVDGANAKTTIKYLMALDENYSRTYQPLLVKIDANGNITKTNLLTCDWSAAPKNLEGKPTTDGFYLYDVAEDGDGNLYVVGRLYRDLTIDATTIKHHNTDEWDGSIQTAAGNGFLLKLNSDLSYNAYICTGGASTQDYFKNVRCHDGKVYVTGLLQGNAAKDAVSLGGKSITPISEKHTIISARLDAATLQADWLVQNSSNSTLQVEDLALSNDADRLFVVGGINNNKAIDTLTVSETIKLTSTATVYQGFIIELDPATGAGVRGLIRSSAGITKIVGVVATTDSVFAYGYDWKTQAILLDSYNNTLELGATYNLVSKGSSAIAFACAAKGDTLVAVNRTRTVAAISWLGSTETFKPTDSGNFYSVVSCFTFPSRNFTPKKDDGTVTAIETIGSEPVQLYTERNMLAIAGAEGQNVRIFTALGQNIATFVAASNYETRTLPQGIYLVAIDGKAHKVVVK